MTTYSGFRVNVSASVSIYNIAIGEFAVYATVGGPNILTGGTPIASIAQSGFPASAAYDNDPTTAWASDNTPTAWLGYMLPAPSAVAAYSITAWSNFAFGNLSPRDFTFDGYDGTNWITLAREALIQWTAAQQRFFFVTGGQDATKAQSYVSLGAGRFGTLTSPKAITYVVLGPPAPPPQRIKVRLMSVPQATA